MLWDFRSIRSKLPWFSVGISKFALWQNVWIKNKVHTTKHTTKEKHNRFVCLCKYTVYYIYKYVYIHIDIWRLYACTNIDVSYVIYVCIITQQHALFRLEISAEQSTSSPVARYWFANSQVKHINTYLSYFLKSSQNIYQWKMLTMLTYIYLKVLFFFQMHFLWMIVGLKGWNGKCG